MHCTNIPCSPAAIVDYERNKNVHYKWAIRVELKTREEHLHHRATKPDMPYLKSSDMNHKEDAYMAKTGSTVDARCHRKRREETSSMEYHIQYQNQEESLRNHKKTYGRNKKKHGTHQSTFVTPPCFFSLLQSSSTRKVEGGNLIFVKEN